jgi:hypothetical protein
VIILYAVMTGIENNILYFQKLLLERYNIIRELQLKKVRKARG